METKNADIKDRLAAVWGINRAEAERQIDRLDALEWAGGDGLASITHAGTIDNGQSDKSSGHNGYWISDGEYIALVTNGDPIWSDLSDEAACTDAGLQWGKAAEMLRGHKI